MPSAYSSVKRVLLGRPLATSASPRERVSRTVGLAAFSSDAVASSAFATQEILHVLVPVAGMAGLDRGGDGRHHVRHRAPAGP